MAEFTSTHQDLNALFAESPDFMALGTGPTHIFVFANQAYKDLVGQRDIVGKPVREALPELAGQGIFELLDAVYADGKPYLAHGMKMAFEKVPGGGLTDVFVDFVYQPVMDSDGKVMGIFVQGHDVTERVEALAKASDDQLRSDFRSKQIGMDSMSATLAHELNQPLTVIANTVRAARRFLAKPTPENIAITQDALADVEDAALRAGELIRRLRDTVSRRHVRNRPENLRQIVEDAFALSEATLTTHAIVHHIEVPAELMVVGDRIQLQQVLVNLINNSVEAINGADERRVTITAHKSDKAAQLCVRDSGRGFESLDDEKRIFELMFTTKKDGLGLGLGICRAIVEAHGGTIWLNRDAPQNDGTAFCFTIPLHDTREPVEATD